MKLWHVIQWGNKDDGPNGWDTQCIVAATDLKSAVDKAQLHIGDFGNGYRDRLADTAHHIGDDGKPDGEAQLVIPVWVAVGINMRRIELWHRHPLTNEWVDHKTMFGDGHAKDSS